MFVDRPRRANRPPPGVVSEKTGLGLLARKPDAPDIVSTNNRQHCPPDEGRFATLAVVYKLVLLTQGCKFAFSSCIENRKRGLEAVFVCQN